MTVGPLVFELIAVFCIAIFLLHHYGRTSKQHPIVTTATLIAWYFSLIIIFILPLDVSSTFYRQCVSQSLEKTTIYQITTTRNGSTIHVNSSDNLHNIALRAIGQSTYSATPHNLYASTFNDSSLQMNISAITTVSADTYSHRTLQTTILNLFSTIYESKEENNSKNTCLKPWSYVPVNTLPTMWRIVYWSSQILTWLVLPFMQSYSSAGDFSTLGKIKRAVIENAVYYGTYLLLFIGLLIYVAATPNLSMNIGQLKVLLVTAANTWGLFLLVLLLGYGLVEVPRGMWNAANNNLSLAQTYFKLAKLSTEKQEAVEDLDDVLEEIKRVSTIVQYNHPMRKHINTIISKCPEDFQSRVSQGMDDYEDYDRGRTDVPAEKSLVRIHRKVIRAMHTKRRTYVQWNILMKKCLHLEDIAKNSKMIERRWKEEFPNGEPQSAFKRIFCSSISLWYWFCTLQPLLRKMLAVCLAALTLMVVWSECTFFNENPVLSLFAIFINLAKANNNFFYIELASCLIISYMCVCAYYTVFRIKFFNYYHIAGHHQTDESSLLFVGIMLCRLTAPLCLNFLGMIHLDTHITADTGVETSYTEIMGHLDVISIISDGFNIYFPILVCVLCIATYFSLGQRCLSAIGFQRFIDATDDMTSDLVDEGKQLVNREKRRLQREMKAMQRAERQSELGHDFDMNARQWSGRMMQDAEATRGGKLVRYNKKKTDKVELLEDVGPTDYSSVADTDDNDTIWEKPSRWDSSLHKSRSTMSNRPPKNLFDDV